MKSLKTVLAVSLLVLLRGLLIPVSAQDAELNTCDLLAADYKRVEQNMAVRMAESVGDDSAPRATLRAMEELNDLMMASMTLQFMRENNCALPKRAPNAGKYLGRAVNCETQRLRGSQQQIHEACNRANWVPGT
ncbi:hypothetical protein [Pseudokordiimonas caeni]|uniref:hypothetical protein n=1 Tax=Pseudokordiimonas caeni TaxID=2997908 RepID=UPI002810A909|nr:hypothetical protein [Pseudokordiimonas caeni]